MIKLRNYPFAHIVDEDSLYSDDRQYKLRPEISYHFWILSNGIYEANVSFYLVLAKIVRNFRRFVEKCEVVAFLKITVKHAAT